MKVFFVGVFLLGNFLAANPSEVIKNANKKAQYQPTTSEFINAGMEFSWEKNRIYQVYTKTGRITDIAFEPEEKILGIAGGDSQRWHVDQTISGEGSTLTHHLFVKPLFPSIATNLVVSTNRRVYHVELHCDPKVPYQAVVSWNYPRSMIVYQAPREIQSEATAKKILDFKNKALDFGYHFVVKKRPSWMPKRIFNDGQKTYIEFANSLENTEAPGLWRLSKSRKREVINFRTHKNFMIVDSIFDIGVLALGEKSKDEVGFEREAAL